MQFLNRYSDVDIPFIEDFIKIQEGDHIHDPFKIDLDIVSKWLDTRKSDLKETLLYSYKENIDYIIIRDIPDKRKRGRLNETILLTPDTFKLLCMRSRTTKSEKVRYYYITLEKLVDIYKDDIIKLQNEKIEQLEYDLKKPQFQVKGCIYVISIDDAYKIGATEDMNKRYKNYKTAHKNNPKIVYIFYSSDVFKLEKCIKLVLQDYEYKRNKEMYMIDLAHIKDMIGDCNKLITKVKCVACKKSMKHNDLKRHIEKDHNMKDLVRFYAVESEF